MRKLCASILALCLLLSLAACTDSPAETTEQTQLPSTESSTTEPSVTEPAEQAPMFSISLPIVHEESNHEDGTLLFNQTYQDIALILPDPDVADKIIVHYLNSLDAVHQEGYSLHSAAKEAYQGQAQWQAYSCSNLYQVKRIDSNVLSLHGTYSNYSGAAHPTHITQSVNYDLITGDDLTLDEVLAVSGSIDQILQLLVGQLEAVKENKQLYPDYSEIIKDLIGFGDFANWHFSNEGLCFCFSPYEIAPYATGVVEATVPYSQLQGILNDAYFPLEWAYEGTVSAESFEHADMNRFTQISELMLHDDGAQILLHSADTAVSNVVIEYGALADDGSSFLAEAAVFACASLTPGDAVILKVMLDDVSPVLRISYQSGTQTIVKYLVQSGENGSMDLIDL